MQTILRWSVIIGKRKSRYTRWKKALQDKGMKLNVRVNKTNAFYTRRNFVRMQIRKYPCSVWGKGVRRNSVQCTKMSTAVVQEVFRSSWKFKQRERFYLQKMQPWCVISRWRQKDKLGWRQHRSSGQVLLSRWCTRYGRSSSAGQEAVT